jgi:DDE family transposase
MFIDEIPNRDSRPAILLRESFREGKRVRKRTIANLSDWPRAKIDALRAVLKGATATEIRDAFEIVRSRPHGHVAAVLGTLRRIGLESAIGSKPSRTRDLCSAMIVARIISPASKLALSRGLDAETVDNTIGEVLSVTDADEDELYEAMDWLRARQETVEKALAKRHLAERTMVLYDVSSTYFEGRRCPLARLGHSRDGRRDKAQIVFGLLTDPDGCPVAVEVFEGNTGDPTTLATQVDKIRHRFGIDRIVIVGDRGLITQARIKEDLKKAPGLDWITALRSPAIQKLLSSGSIQLSLFDERDLAEISSPDYPGERLIVCKNPLLAADRKRKREELLCATEKELEKIRLATQRKKNPLRGKDTIGLRAGKVLGQYKVGKHFRLRITEAAFHYERNTANIEAESALDGLYVIRTSLGQALPADDVVLAYKRLAQVERAFRSMKSVDLKIRPIHHRLAERVRAHVFLCMLAFYVEWHMRRALASMLFDDDDKAAAHDKRASVVAKAQRSDRALSKAARKTTDDGAPVHSFRTLLTDLATIVQNTIQPAGDAPSFDRLTTPTPLQKRALELLAVRL